MDISKQDQLVKLLKSHPNGIKVIELQTTFGYSSKKGVTNLIYLLKQKGYNFEKKDGIYKLLPEKNSPDTIDIKPDTQLSIILKALEEHPDGLDPLELERISGCDRKSLPNRIWHLRQNGCKIVCNNGVYSLEGKRQVPSPKKGPAQKLVQHISPPKTMTYKLIPAEYRKAFLSLSDSDKSDCIDMIRKSVFYNKSAIALLESNKITLELIEAIESGI